MKAETIKHMSSQCCVQWYHIGNLKSCMVYLHHRRSCHMLQVRTSFQESWLNINQHSTLYIPMTMDNRRFFYCILGFFWFQRYLLSAWILVSLLSHDLVSWLRIQGCSLVDHPHLTLINNKDNSETPPCPQLDLLLTHLLPWPLRWIILCRSLTHSPSAVGLLAL